MHELRKGMCCLPQPQDRLWRVTGPNFSVGFTEYNDEVTGFAPLLRQLFKIGAEMRYGARASYIIKRCQERGWTVEHVEDRDANPR